MNKVESMNKWQASLQTSVWVHDTCFVNYAKSTCMLTSWRRSETSVQCLLLESAAACSKNITLSNTQGQTCTQEQSACYITVVKTNIFLVWARPTGPIPTPLLSVTVLHMRRSDMITATVVTNSTPWDLIKHSQVTSLVSSTTFQSINTTEAMTKRSISLKVEQRTEVEKEMRYQGSSVMWHVGHMQHVTGSKCDQIWQYQEKAVIFLLLCVYHEPVLILPKPIAWGTKTRWLSSCMWGIWTRMDTQVFRLQNPKLLCTQRKVGLVPLQMPESLIHQSLLAVECSVTCLMWTLLGTGFVLRLQFCLYLSGCSEDKSIDGDWTAFMCTLYFTISFCLTVK